MKKAFIFILLITGFVWSCKEKNNVTAIQNQVSASGTKLYISDQNTPSTGHDLATISASLNKLVESEKDPESLIKTALSLRTNRLFGDSLSLIAANFLLQKAINIIEDFNFSSNLFKAAAYRRMADELQEQGVPIDIPLSSFRKVIINIQQKNYHYLFTRLQLQVKLIITQASANHQVFFIVSIFLVATLIGFLVKTRRYFYSLLLTLIGAGVFVLIGMAPKSTNSSKYSFREAMFDFKIENDIGSDQILNEQRIPIGKLIYFNENAVGFSYHFSPLTISPIIDSIAKMNQLLLNTTVSFVNNKMEPVGFNAINGNILNPMINFHWDGLMLITDNKMEVVPLNNGKNNHLTNNFESYFQLTQRVKNNRSCASQVPLLVYNDSLMLNPQNANPKLRESRFLMKLITPEKEGFYLIADIDNFYPLAYNTLAILNKLKADNYSVQFMVLLDVGANNYFQVYNPDGKMNNHYISTLPASKATNILSVFFLQKSIFSHEL